MCKIMEDLSMKLAKGEAEKAAKEADYNAKKSTALAMIKKGKLSYEEISEYTGLTVKEIKALAEGKTA